MFTGASMPRKRAITTIARGNAAKIATAARANSQESAYFSSRLFRRIILTIAASATTRARRIVICNFTVIIRYFLRFLRHSIRIASVTLII